MKKFFRYMLLGAGVVVALLVAAIVGLYFIGRYAGSGPRAACSTSEDFVVTRSKLKSALEDGSIDEQVIEREDAFIQKALDLCASGEKDKSRTLLIGVLMDAAFQSDAVYARKVNGAARTGNDSGKRKVGSPQGDPDDPKRNPHPIKRYELIATAHAPGSWDSVTGTLTYVVNPDCVPEGFHSRGWLVPNVAYRFEMKPVGHDTWKGYFYRDTFQGDNYFGLGECRWDAAHVTAEFAVHGTTFPEVALLYFDKDASFDPKQDYFLKSVFSEKAHEGGQAMSFSHYNSDTSTYPERYFTISASVKPASL